MRLSHRDFDALQQTLLELYAHRDLATFRKVVPDLFLKLEPADNFHWQECALDFATKSVRTLDYFAAVPIAASSFARADNAVFGHPFTKHMGETGRPTALKISDFFTRTQFENSALYNEVYRYFGARGALSTAVKFTPTSGSSINFHSHRNDFTERDRLILDLLRPHFQQALRNATLTSQKTAAGSKPLASFDLSPRELEIARWIGNGKTNPEIAIILSISGRTVEKHMEKILEKLGVENRTAAAVLITNAADDQVPVLNGFPK